MLVDRRSCCSRRECDDVGREYMVMCSRFLVCRRYLFCLNRFIQPCVICYGVPKAVPSCFLKDVSDLEMESIQEFLGNVGMDPSETLVLHQSCLDEDI